MVFNWCTYSITSQVLGYYQCIKISYYAEAMIGLHVLFHHYCQNMASWEVLRWCNSLRPISGLKKGWQYLPVALRAFMKMSYISQFTATQRRTGLSSSSTHAIFMTGAMYFIILHCPLLHCDTKCHGPVKVFYNSSKKNLILVLSVDTIST